MKILSRLLKCSTAFLLILLASSLAATILNQDIETYAQTPGEENIPPSQLPPPTNPNDANVILAATAGGTTDPVTGIHEYPNGTVITLTATPQKGFKFQEWVIDGLYTDTNNLPPIYLTADENPADAPPRPAAEDRLVLTTNPLRILCGYGWSFQYQAVFVPEVISSASADAVVTVLSAVGGTTNPSPGTYNYANGTTYTLTATADAGFEFKEWVVSGSYMPGHGVTGEPELDSHELTSNPLDVSCGYGYTYTYQPLFVPIGSETSTGIPANTVYIIVIVLVVIAIIAVAVAVYMSTKRSK